MFSFWFHDDLTNTCVTVNPTGLTYHSPAPTVKNCRCDFISTCLLSLQLTLSKGVNFSTIYHIYNITLALVHPASHRFSDSVQCWAAEAETEQSLGERWGTPYICFQSSAALTSETCIHIHTFGRKPEYVQGAHASTRTARQFQACFLAFPVLTLYSQSQQRSVVWKMSSLKTRTLITLMHSSQSKWLLFCKLNADIRCAKRLV